MSKNLSELCSLIVEDIFGALPSRLFSILQRHGRLSLEQIRQHARLPRPRLKPPQDYAKAGLAVLVQHQLVMYSMTDNVTFYEANAQNAYSLIRLGKIVKHGQDKYGDGGRLVLENLGVLGQASIEELSSTQSQERSLPNSENVNGVKELQKGTNEEEETTTAPNQTRKALSNACDDRFIVKCRELDYFPPTEFQEALESHVLEDEFKSAVKGTAQKQEYHKALKRKRSEWEDDNEVMLPEISTTQKRSKSQADVKSKKRKKLNNEAGHESDGAQINSIEDDDEYTHEATLVRMDHHKMNVAFRSRRLIELSARSLGENTSKIYACLLTRLERRLRRCHAGRKDEDDAEGPDGHDSGPSITTVEVEEEFIARQGKASETKPTKSKRARKIVDETDVMDDTPKVNGETGEHAATDHKDERSHLETIEQELRLLEEDPHKFVRRVGSRGHGDWQVDFSSLAQQLIQFELENVVLARFGPKALRVVRILHAKGKLDDKQVSSLGLLPPKQLRELLVTMQEAGFVDTQEIPRDFTRQPSRTIYLWFYDQERCRKLVLEDTYKAMARLLQRAKYEREKVRPVLEKAERTDVKGHEEELLAPAELDALQAWQDKEEKILVQLARQDNLVGVLRDFSP